MRKLWLITLVAVLLLPVSLVLPAQSVMAVSASDWKAGRIIDDGLFTNANDMSVGDIQAFLNSKVPACDNNGQKSVGYYYNASTGQPKFSSFAGGTWTTTTRAVFAQRYGSYYQSNVSNLPFTCLKDYYEVPKTAPGPGLPASNAFGAPIPAGAVSAAQMIYNASIKYSINPKVLLIKLHTESAGPLTTDDWPFQNQYLYAMGAHCPDSGPGGSANCDSNYAGFSIQMDEAADLLRWYRDSMTQSWWQYKKPYQVNSILWNVAPTGCGAGNVHIETKASAALYTYTPYQPNAAALANMYGTGDGCSAYGNRNFWRVWNDWFGSPLATSFSAQPLYQQLYSDSNRTVPAGWNASALTNKTLYARVIMKNTGNSAWTKSGAFGITDTRLATSSPWGRPSLLCDDSTWVIPCTRAGSLIENNVAPGALGTFEFVLKTPSRPGAYTEKFTPIIDGRTVFSSGEMVFKIDVYPDIFAAQPVWQQVYTDNTKAFSLGWNAELVAGSKAHVVVAMKNTGNTTWTKSGSFTITDTRLATYGPWGRDSLLCDESWIIKCSRPAPLNEATVNPGQIGTFEFTAQAPRQPGNYSESFAPIVDGRTLFSSGAMTINLSVKPAVFSAQPIWQQIYTDSSKSTPLGWNADLVTGQSAYAVVVFKNTGNTTWTKSGSFTITDTRLATYGPWGRQSIICNNSWLINCTRPAGLNETSVAPGENGSFEFPIKAPSQPGSYSESFAPVVDGRTVFNNGGMAINLTVR
ncbi:hypothetical protein IPL85_01825 [Candidatus Saccharibacteria bacterium]|nr:MAG: hypothetical protein IPL85_01825 [Candidatus Saccharibacteria bacterium]